MELFKNNYLTSHDVNVFMTWEPVYFPFYFNLKRLQRL